MKNWQKNLIVLSLAAFLTICNYFGLCQVWLSGESFIAKASLSFVLMAGDCLFGCLVTYGWHRFWDTQLLGFDPENWNDRSSLPKWIRLTVAIIVSVVLIGATGFLIYHGIYHRPNLNPESIELHWFNKVFYLISIVPFTYVIASFVVGVACCLIYGFMNLFGFVKWLIFGCEMDERECHGGGYCSWFPDQHINNFTNPRPSEK